MAVLDTNSAPGTVDLSCPLTRAVAGQEVEIATVPNEPPYIAIVDDDEHSVRLLTRTLHAQGMPDVRHLGCGQQGDAALCALLTDPDGRLPDLVVVDLKSHSAANSAFAERHHAALRCRGIPLVVMSCPLDEPARRAMREAGAMDIFFRHAERDAYRREVARLLDFRARQRASDRNGM